MEIMELNEEIVDLDSNAPELKKVEETNKERMNEYIKAISDAFNNDDIEVAKSALIRLKYFTNIDDKIKVIHRKNMDS